jgi:hypothetical protein
MATLQERINMLAGEMQGSGAMSDKEAQMMQTSGVMSDKETEMMTNAPQPNTIECCYSNAT